MDSFTVTFADGCGFSIIAPPPFAATMTLAYCMMYQRNPSLGDMLYIMSTYTSHNIQVPHEALVLFMKCLRVVFNPACVPKAIANSEPCRVCCNRRKRCLTCMENGL